MEEQQQCYTPVLLPVVCFQTVEQFSLPPPIDSNSVDELSEVSREGSEDFALQLECALTYEKEWYEIEDKLFVRVFWMPLLSNCFVESEDSDYRSWGTNGDFDALFKIIAYKYKSIGLVRDQSVVFLTSTGERKIMTLQHGLRKIRAYPEHLALVITKNSEVYHLQSDFHANQAKPHQDLEQFFVLAILRAAARDGVHICFW